MKSKRKISTINTLKTRSDFEVTRHFDGGKLKRKTASTLSIRKTSEFLQKHHKIFSKVSLNRGRGDADNYFRQSLRKYDYLSLEGTKQKSSTRSATSFTQKSDKSVKKSKNLSVSIEESDIDIYYSPTSIESSRTLTQEDISKEIPKMESEDYAIPSETTEDEPDNTDTTKDETTEEEDGGEDDFKKVEELIAQATDELEHVVESNQQLFDELNEGEDETVRVQDLEDDGQTKGGDAGAGGESGSFFKFDSGINAAVLRELEDAEKQAKQTAEIINELKIRVQELLKKEKMTETESKELEEKNKQLKAQMVLFEQKTKRIQCLLAQTELFDKMVPCQPPAQVKRDEDNLPKVVICGTQQNFPQIILCDDTRGKHKKRDVPNYPAQMSARKDCCCKQGDQQGFGFQQNFASQNPNTNYMQRLDDFQSNMKMLCTPTRMAPQMQQQKPACCSPCCTKKGQPPMEPVECPAKQLENQLNTYSETTGQLEQQLRDMEADVKKMQDELSIVQSERQHLEHHRKVLCYPPCLQPPCLPHPCCPPPPPCFDPGRSGSADQQLRGLQEQYNRLQDDYKGKLIEVGVMRADNEKFKKTAKEADEQRKKMEDKIKEYERDLKLLKGEKNKYLGSKEQLVEQEQQLVVAKQRFREAQDELEELRACVEEQKGQVDDYRNKYLAAQQEVEEHRRKISLMELDAERLSEQVNLDIQRVKNQFQEKLQELAPLPDLLKTTQLKLQEAQKMHLLAERNNEALSKDLQLYKDKVAAYTDQIENARSDQQLGVDEKVSLSATVAELQSKCDELQEEIGNVQYELENANNLAEEHERTANAKMHEIVQLTAQLDTVREESARQVARNKDRCETVRRSMQNQISELERLLAQSRAQARCAQKDRDEVRLKMQAQINNLHENFEDAQMRIRSLQGHVNFMRESYSTASAGDAPANSDPCACPGDM